MVHSATKVSLEMKSKYFKDTLILKLKENNIEPLKKQIVPYFKAHFKINLVLKDIFDGMKVKNIIKDIIESEKVLDAEYTRLKRIEYGII
jgi:hypothetical protein